MSSDYWFILRGKKGLINELDNAGFNTSLLCMIQVNTSSRSALNKALKKQVKKQMGDFK